MRLEGKTAVVTGGASGIGRATAETLAAAGAHVVIGDLDQDKGATVAAAIRDGGGKASYFSLDVTSQDSVGAFARSVETQGLEVDIVVNVAGWGKIQPFMENSPDFWRKVIDLNLLGPVLVTHAFLGGMIARGRGGKVVTVASDAGRVGSSGETVYSGAKGGAIAFGKALAREMARYKINVNSVCPGPTDTPLLAAVPEKHQEAFVKATPMRRLGKPKEIADAVLFFASDLARWVTGQTLYVDGGVQYAGYMWGVDE